MNIHKVLPPANYLEYDREDGELSDYDLNHIPDTVTDIWYWYAQGSYDGSGIMVLKTSDGYYLHDMSHCSCYGPLDNFELTKCYKTIEDLKTNCSEELENLLPLIN